jgi:2-amino-4-hydroxy-6-hydroxymethyldihydropteridine diphosphokinase
MLRRVISVVRVSGVMETDPVGAPSGSPRFLNAVVAGHTSLPPEDLLVALQAIEAKLGRRRGVRNAPRTIDLDLIFYSARLRRTPALTLPHPRYREREFVTGPLRELRLGWRDPRGAAPQKRSSQASTSRVMAAKPGATKSRS